MKARTHRPRKLYLSMVLSMVALLAQMWMVQVSAGHQGQVLAQQLMAGDICTQQTSAQDLPAAPPAGHKMDGSSVCSICSLAAASFTPGREPAAIPEHRALALHNIRFSSVSARPLRHANTLPQAQAPPAA